jgi:hypothetical protein
VDKGGLLNAVPGTDPGGAARYNGDGPADIMGATLQDLDLEYRRAWGRPVTYEEMQAVFRFCTGPYRDGASNPADLNPWLEDAVRVTGHSEEEILRLPEETLDELAMLQRERYSWTWDALDRAPEPGEAPPPEVQKRYEDEMTGLVEDALGEARRVLGLKEST